MVVDQVADNVANILAGIVADMKVDNDMVADMEVDLVVGKVGLGGLGVQAGGLEVGAQRAPRLLVIT